MAPTDAFLWDVEQVVQNLCAEGATWTKDTSQLADKIRDEEVDGKTLLTFEQTCSRQELMDCLGIRLARHKASLSEKLVNLRSGSTAYRDWHQDFVRKVALQPEEDPSNASEAKLAPTVDTNDSDARNGSLPREETTLNGDHTTNHREKRSASPIVNGNSEESVPKPTTANPLRKKRRTQPINISTLPMSKPTNEGFPWDEKRPGTYLGEGRLEKDFVLVPRGIISNRLVHVNATDFVSNTQDSLPPGRRIAVNRIIKRLLRHNGKKEALLRNGEDPIKSVTPSETEDDVLSLGDLPSEWDEDTRREMEDERQDIEEWEELQRSQRYVPREHIQAILDDEIQRMTTRWRERKLIKLERKAYDIWTRAQRRGSTAIEVIEARKRFNWYKERIQKLCVPILDLKWETDQEVRAQAQCVEQSVEDKLYEHWVIDTLESRIQPPKPEVIPRQTKPRPKRQFNPLDEVLTSSDEDDFIVPDGEDSPSEPMQGVEPANTTPVKDESSYPCMDLTQSGPRERKKDPEYIDLTTPTKPKAKQTAKEATSVQDLQPPPIESLGTMEDICSVEKNHWSDRNDRWRLVIYMLGKLTFGRRADILARMKANANEDVWLNAIIAFTSSPVEDAAEIEQSETKTTDFDITRIFLSFVKCRIQSEKRLTPLNQRSKKKILDQGGTMFSPFCDFIRKAEPIFPQASQIYRTDDIEVLPDDEDDVDEEEDEASQRTPSKPRKSAPKEIIRNKDAVDLREREQRRARDQEARRLKLRATLASSGSVSQDRSRLIINESKEEDQSLLYVNRDIGKTIKNYQVDGVRFLWNQIVLDPDMRQGCLLAHTMGLGKTMQVITFLVAIAEAAASSDPSLRSQVPKDLRRSQTLVLCPSGLVNNWIDELLKWAPSGILGALSQLDSTAKQDERTSILRTWAEGGGVLVVGYNMFKRLADDQEYEQILLEKPNIVVADEAHVLKNPLSKTNQLCSRFSTTSRIALTGSPLANNVEEYYSTISWVAPNFLGPLSEFQEIYVRDIEAGLAGDSLAWERRKALKMLQVLKDTVAPKVNRATIKSCLAHDLPPKSEFVISLPASDMQKELYKLYLEGVNAMIDSAVTSKGRIFGIINDLAAICNHPRCFHQKVLDARKNPEKHTNFPESIISGVLRITKGTDNKQPSLSLKVQYLVKILDEARTVGDKVLVFSQSIYTLDYLEFLLATQKRSICRLDGSTKIDQRQEKIRDFNVGDKEIYLISTTAGGVGLNIQGANRVVIFDSRWNPVADQQAVGRSYRLGQVKHVYVYHLMVAGTFEEALQSQAVFKTQLASRVVDKKNPIAWGNRHAKITEQAEIKEMASQDLTGFVGKDHILDALINDPPSAQGHIKRIVSTDTFEEEDINTNLTDEERREAEDLVTMNRLRRTDPAEYERMKARHAHNQVAYAAHLASTVESASRNEQAATVPTLPTQGPPQQVQVPVPPSKNPVQVNHNQSGSGMGGSSSATPGTTNETSARNEANTSNPILATPRPMAGANTFFGQHSEQAPPPPATPPPQTPIVVEEWKSPGTNIFSQPQSPEKKKFQKKMEAVTKSMKDYGVAGVSGRPETLVTTLTDAIHQVRRQKKMGFLPDNQQWRSLSEMLDHERFVLAALSGVLTPSFLANATKSALQTRVTTLNGLSEVDFQAQMAAPTKGPDPENLQNIRRSSLQPGGSLRKNEDAKVMREAADNRKQRKPKLLPGWARDDLRRNSFHESGTPDPESRSQRTPQ